MAAAKLQGLSPGFKFEPSDDMLVGHFLLPYLRDKELPVPGLVFVDDHPRSLLLPPWMLLDRHGRGDEDDAYFIGPAAGEGRQVRSVAGGGKWVKQRTEAKGKVVLGGETFRWEKLSLNFHRDDRRSGSTGWVMHEYVVFPPAGSDIAASHRASHIAFTGHGQNRKRVPDSYVVVLDDDVQTTTTTTSAAAAAAAPPSESEQSYQDQEYAAYTDQNQQCFVPEQQSNQHYFPAAAAEQSNHQQFLPELEQTQSNQEYTYSEQSNCYVVPEQQSNQHYFPASATEQSNHQQFLPALEQTQSNQEYTYSEQSNCYVVPEQQQSNQQAEYAFACYEQQQHFHGDLSSWQEPLAATSSQQFLGQEQMLPDGPLDDFDDGGLTISPEEGDAFINEMEMQEIIAGLLGNQSGRL